MMAGSWLKHLSSSMNSWCYHHGNSTNQWQFLVDTPDSGNWCNWLIVLAVSVLHWQSNSIWFRECTTKAAYHISANKGPSQMKDRARIIDQGSGWLEISRPCPNRRSGLLTELIVRYAYILRFPYCYWNPYACMYSLASCLYCSWWWTTMFSHLVY